MDEGIQNVFGILPLVTIFGSLLVALLFHWLLPGNRAAGMAAIALYAGACSMTLGAGLWVSQDLQEFWCYKAMRGGFRIIERVQGDLAAGKLYAKHRHAPLYFLLGLAMVGIGLYMVLAACGVVDAP